MFIACCGTYVTVGHNVDGYLLNRAVYTWTLFFFGKVFFWILGFLVTKSKKLCGKDKTREGGTGSESKDFIGEHI